MKLRPRDIRRLYEIGALEGVKFKCVKSVKNKLHSPLIVGKTVEFKGYKDLHGYHMYCMYCAAQSVVYFLNAKEISRHFELVTP